MNAQRKSIAVFILMFIALISCGFGFKKKSVTLNTEKYIFFKNCSVEQILSDLRRDEDSAKDMYDDGFYAIEGVVNEISGNHKSVIIGNEKDSDKLTIECTAAEKSVVEALGDLKPGEKVVVYGKIKISALQGNLTVKTTQMIRAGEETVSGTKYSLIEGSSYDMAVMKRKTLAGGKVEYYIPEKWAEVEVDNRKNNKKSMEGYQYVLNEISGEVEAEDFFVCYFDSSTLLNDQGQKSDKKGIRKAIVDNILKTDIKKSEIEKIDAYYGSEYYYYDGSYTDKQEQKHRIEFVFQEAGDDGMVVYLYVFDAGKEKHLEDILAVMRFLEVEGQ